MFIFNKSSAYLKKTFKRDLFAISLLLLGTLSLMFSNYVKVSQADRNSKHYISLAGELRILSQSLAKDTLEAISGGKKAFQDLKVHQAQFAENLRVLDQGNSKIDLPGTSEEISRAELSRLKEAWTVHTANIDNVLKYKQELLRRFSLKQSLEKLFGELDVAYSNVVSEALKKNITVTQLAQLTGQSLRAERIARTVNQTLLQGKALGARQTLNKDLKRLDTVLAQLSKQGLHDQARLSKIKSTQSQLNTEIGALLKMARGGELIAEAGAKINANNEQLLSASTNLMSAYVTSSERQHMAQVTEYILAGVSVFLMLLLAFRAYYDARLNLKISAERNENNQKAISLLLHELGDLADGDLTVEATVDNSLTKEIAESTNYAIVELRNLVSTINQASAQVSLVAQEAQDTSNKLASANKKQAREISGVTAAVNAMASAIEQVSTNASESFEVSENSVNIATDGVQVVQNSIMAMDKIRDQIQETSKRIKRLGESSQEIGDTVSLIADIADQTNILALNAAIQAAMAGESGRGFGVVADEVQRLAERSGHATKQIAALVKTIQSDINEAMVSMEQSTTEVVGGAKLTQDAGVALEKIENVSSHLAELIQNISKAAQQQVLSSAKISKTMDIVQEIANQSSADSSETLSVISNLSEFVSELKSSVAGFKLPGARKHG